jgi:hypothetical protein
MNWICETCKIPAKHKVGKRCPECGGFALVLREYHDSYMAGRALGRADRMRGMGYSKTAITHEAPGHAEGYLDGYVNGF